MNSNAFLHGTKYLNNAFLVFDVILIIYSTFSLCLPLQAISKVGACMLEVLLCYCAAASSADSIFAVWVSCGCSNAKHVICRSHCELKHGFFKKAILCRMHCTDLSDS